MAILHMIGSGTPTPTAERFGTCFVLEIENERVMIDCGPAATHKLVKAGLWPTQIQHLFFTHHHFDHNADYPCFLLCRWDQSSGKEPPLKVWGPPPTKLVTERLIGEEGAYVFDWKARVNHPASQRIHQNRGGILPRPGPKVDITEIGAGPVFKAEKWSVRAEVVRHVEPWLNSVGYRFEFGGKSVVFTSDTVACSGLTRLAAGCDVVVTNCWGSQAEMIKTGEDQCIGGTLDAAKVAREAGAKMLVITHTGAKVCREEDKKDAMAEIGRNFSGKVVFGEELMKIAL
ncbi:MAG: MBL fold metallo-hydrolase [Phycisphaerales bacterium]|nr:MBL fold metallo-hydrolase [Phycisphaerales bacterium]